MSDLALLEEIDAAEAPAPALEQFHPQELDELSLCEWLGRPEGERLSAQLSSKQSSTLRGSLAAFRTEPGWGAIHSFSVPLGYVGIPTRRALERAGAIERTASAHARSRYRVECPDLLISHHDEWVLTPLGIQAAAASARSFNLSYETTLAEAWSPCRCGSWRDWKEALEEDQAMLDAARERVGEIKLRQLAHYISRARSEQEYLNNFTQVSLPFHLLHALGGAG